MKRYLLLIVIVCVTLTAKSQAKIELGLKGGLNMAKADVDESGIDSESTTGYHIGAYGLVKIANIGIQPEILYSLQGTELSIDGVSSDLSQDFKYLNIPVMLKLYLLAGLNLQLGPQFGILLDAEGEVIDPDTGNVVERDLSNQLKSSDLSAAMGAGWDLPFGLSVSARYVLGLNDVNDTSGGSTTKNRVFQVSVGYSLFKLGK